MGRSLVCSIVVAAAGPLAGKVAAQLGLNLTAPLRPERATHQIVNEYLA